MSEPVRIIVTAQTAQAAAELHRFVSGAGSDLSTLPKVATEGAKGVETLAGKVYYLRSAIDGIRFAAMDGGARAAFYAVDELTRGVAAAGISFTKLIPYLGAAAAAAAVLGLEWYAVLGGMENTTKETENLVSALDKVPKLLQQIQTLSKAGLITPDRAKELSDQVTGRKKQYVKSDGTLTDSPSAQTEYNTSSPFSPYTTKGTATVNYQPATLKQQQDAAQKTLDDYSQEQAKAIIELHAAEQKAHDENMSNIEKEKAAVLDKYQKQIDEITKDAALAGAPLTIGGVRNPKADAQAFTAIKELKAAQDQELADIDAKAQAKQAAAELATAAKWSAEKKQIVATQDQQLADAIEANREQTTDKSVKLYQQEYDARLALAKQQLADETISEDEFAHKVSQANKERVAGEQAYQAEVQKTIQIKQELARTDAEVALKRIDTNPFATATEKSRASIPATSALLGQNSASIAAQQDIAGSTKDDAARAEALNKVNALTIQQIDLQRQLTAAENAGNFGFQLGLVITKLRDIPTLAQQAAATIGTTFNTAVNSISGNLTKIIEGTDTWRKGLLSIARDVVGEVIQGTIRMAVQWVLSHVVMTAASKLLAMFERQHNAESVADTIRSCLTKIAGHAGTAAAGAAAAEASVPYAGPALAVAAAAAMLATVLSYGNGFQAGGYTGDGPVNEFAGFVHRGEFVLPSSVVNRVGVSNIETMLAQGGGGAGGSNVTVHAQPHVVVVNDRSEMLNAMKSAAGKNITIAHVQGAKNQIGIGIPS